MDGSDAMFDVFLCHNSKDKDEVIRIARLLQERNLKPWLDQWELTPGRPWQVILEQQIEKVKAAAVFVGESGLGPWQDMEQRAFLREFVNRGCPVIPVILCGETPKLPIFLNEFTWVDFRKTHPDPLDQLAWGITGEKEPHRETPHRDDVLPEDTLPEPAPLPPGSVMPLSVNHLFVGRTHELKILAKTLQEGRLVQVAAATGMGGVGKTQLAAAFVHCYGQFFPGGVFWMSFARKDGVKTEIARLGQPRAMNLFPREQGKLDEQVDLVLKEWQKPIKRLLVFDNCESETLFHEWCPKTGGCRVLVTSRMKDWDPAWVNTVSLDVLTETESLEFLRKFLDSQDTELVEIARELGYLPLAMHLAGSYLKRMRSVTPGKYLEQIRDKAILDHRSLAGWSGAGRSPTDHEWNVGKTFALSLDLLDREDPLDDLAVILLQSAACFAPGEPIPYDLLSGVREEDEETVDQAVDRLLQVGLLEEEKKALKLHRLLADFVVKTGVEDAVRSQVEKAVLAKADAQNDAGDPGPLLEWQEHLKAVVTGTKEREHSRTAGLYNALGHHLVFIADYTNARSYFEQALGIRKKTLGENHPDTAETLNNLDFLLQDMGDLPAAKPYLEQALTIKRKVLKEDHPDTAISLNNLGVLVQSMGDLSAAKPYLEQALGIWRKALGENHPDTALSLNNLGALLQDMGDLPAAKTYYEQALSILRMALREDHPYTAATLSNLGILHKTLGQPAAKSYLEQALAIYQKTLGEDHPDTARTMAEMGIYCKTIGELDRAQTLIQQAFDILTQRLGETHPTTLQAGKRLEDLHQDLENKDASRD